MASPLSESAPVDGASRAPMLAALNALLPLVGAAASSALLIDYAKKSAVFCADGGGCGRVRAWASAAHLPLPAIGLAAFTILATIALLRGPRARWIGAAMAVGGGVAAVGLVALQAFVIRAFCTYCLVADAAALATAVTAILRARRGAEVSAGRLRRALPALTVLAAIGPAGLGATRPPRLPSALAPIVAADGGRLSVVVFTDFECPYCRALHPKLEAALAPLGEAVVVHRIDKPLRLHPHARDAARAHACVARLDPTPAAERHASPLAERYAHGLFLDDDEALTTPMLARHAVAVGVDKEALARCLLDPAVEELLNQDAALFTAAGGVGLPLVFIGRARVEGDTSAEELAALVAQERAALTAR